MRRTQRTQRTQRTAAHEVRIAGFELRSDRVQRSDFRELEAAEMHSWLGILARCRPELQRRYKVDHVDVGYRRKDGRLTNEIAVRVHVRQKKRPAALRRGETVRPVGGFPIDVVQSRPVSHVAGSASRSYVGQRLDPLAGGGASANPNVPKRGTLGAIVFDQRTRRPMALSCYHVYMEGEPGEGLDEAVHQPYTGFNAPQDRIGTVDRGDKRLDCSAVLLDMPQRSGRGVSTDIVGVPGGIKGVVAPRLGMLVVKTGAETGTTRGIIEGVHEGGFTVAPLPGAVGPLCDPGDSGAVWLEEASHAAVGLHWGGEDVGEPERAQAHTISRVAARLDLELVRRTVLPLRTRHAPTVAALGDGLVLVTVQGASARLRVSSLGGQLRSKTLATSTQEAPAVAVHREQPWIAWVDRDTHRLHVSGPHAGPSGSGMRLEASSLSSPALAVARDRLFIAWRDLATDRISIAVTSGGARWEMLVRLDARTDRGPALTAFADGLLVAYHEASTDRLRVLRGTTAGHFAPAATIDQPTRDRPSLVADEARAWLAWRSVGGRLGVVSSGDGRRWGGRLELREEAGSAPALARLGDDLIWCWADPEGRVVTLRHQAPHE